MRGRKWRRAAQRRRNRRLTYGQVAADAAKIKLDKEPAIKTPDQFKLIGKPMPRLDTPVKVNGEAKFGIDAKVPNMVYASIISCPVPGGTLASVDESGLAGKRGIVKVVKLKDAVVVVADNTWRAMEGLKALKITWDYGPGGNSDSAQMKQMYRDTLTEPMVQVRRTAMRWARWQMRREIIEVRLRSAASGACADGAAERDRIGAAEPHRCVDRARRLRSPRCNRRRRRPGMKPEQVYIHDAYVGGGFGRRSKHDEMEHAIAASRELGRPVKVTWTREQDIRGDRYRPQAAAKFRAALGPDGMPLAVECESRGRFDQPLARPAGGKWHRGTGRRWHRQLALQDSEFLCRRGDEEHPSAGALLAFGRRFAELLLLRKLHRRTGACGRKGPVPIPPRHGGPQGFRRRARNAARQEQLGQASCRGAGAAALRWRKTTARSSALSRK